MMQRSKMRGGRHAGLFLILLLVVSAGRPLWAAGNGTGSELPDDAATARLSAALQFRTISAHGGIAAEFVSEFQRFQQFLRRSYPRVFRQLEQEPLDSLSLLLRWPGSDPQADPVMLIAHQDVVPVESDSAADWTHAPFSGAIADGFIWGRGAIDNKAALLASLEAVDALIGAGFQPRRSVYLLFSHDEETERKGAAQAAERIRQRGERLDYILDEGGLVVGEAMPGVQSDLAMVGVAQKGYLTLRLSVAGSGGHSSMPPADNAVAVLAGALQRLVSQPFPADLRFLRPMLEAMAPELPLLQRLLLGNLWLTGPLVRGELEKKTTQNAMMRTTIAPTMLRGSAQENVLPTLAEATVNFRIFPGQTIDQVIAGVRERIDDERVRIDVGMAQEASPVSGTESGAWQALVQAINDVHGAGTVHAVPGLTVAITDSSRFNDVAAQIYRFNYNEVSLADLKRIHGIDERIGVDSYRKMIEFYRLLLGSSTL